MSRVRADITLCYESASDAQVIPLLPTLILRVVEPWRNGGRHDCSVQVVRENARGWARCHEPIMWGASMSEFSVISFIHWA